MSGFERKENSVEFYVGRWSEKERKREREREKEGS